MTDRIPIVLSIAGSDNSGGAGIQADLKTCTLLGAYCATAITAVTSQNSRGVSRCDYTGDDSLRNQLSTILTDFRPDAVKIGMLPNADAISIVAEAIEKYRLENIVIDPVMSATVSKDAELGIPAIRRLFPSAALVTPNIPEALQIIGAINDAPYTEHAESESDRIRLADSFLKISGTKAVLLKGGHSNDGSVTDILLTAKGDLHIFSGKRIDSEHTHGTGCALSTAIAAGLAKGLPLREAVGMGKTFVTRAIRRASEQPVRAVYAPVDLLVRQ